MMDQACGSERQKADGQAVIDAWQESLLRAGPAAPRFKLKPGQALVCDNYRIMHGREPHYGDRLLWRCWIWTTQRLDRALPENCLCMCSPVGRVAAARAGFKQSPCPHCPQADVLDKVRNLGRQVAARPWPNPMDLPGVVN